MLGSRAGPAKERNIYFGAVNVNPADSSTVVGAFPVQLGESAAVAVAVSCDGVHFSPLTTVLKGRVSFGGRTSDHPVDGLIRRGDAVFLYIRGADVSPTGRGDAAAARWVFL